jgi:hypothetical protein
MPRKTGSSFFIALAAFFRDNLAAGIFDALKE